MGTLVEITLFKEDRDIDSEKIVNEVFMEIKRLEGLLGRHQEGSDVWRVNRGGEAPLAVSPETLEVVEEGLRFNALTDGAFDIRLGRLIELWDFEGEGKEPPDESEIKKILPGIAAGSVEADRVKNTLVKKGDIHLDLGGIAKGYIIDRAGRLMMERGIKNFIINAGGDMVIKGRKGDAPWRIGLQHPRKSGEVFAHIDVEEENVAIVTSGDYERFFMHDGKRYHHILDPRTGYPARGLISATIVAGDAETADALCTAVFVLGRERGMKLIESMSGVEGLVVDDNMDVAISKGLKGRVVLRWKEKN